MTKVWIPEFEFVRFDPTTVVVQYPDVDIRDMAALGARSLGHYTTDGPGITCDLQAWWCRDRAALAGGFDEHHHWPEFLGGPDKTGDMLTLCPLHHRRIHALIRAMVEHGTTLLETVRYFTPSEHAVASFGVSKWFANGQPAIAGWSCPAAAVKAA